MLIGTFTDYIPNINYFLSAGVVRVSFNLRAKTGQILMILIKSVNYWAIFAPTQKQGSPT